MCVGGLGGATRKTTPTDTPKYLYLENPLATVLTPISFPRHTCTPTDTTAVPFPGRFPVPLGVRARLPPRGRHRRRRHPRREYVRGT